jgi:hypothetical protein
VLLNLPVAYRVSSFTKETCTKIKAEWDEIRNAVRIPKVLHDAPGLGSYSIYQDHQDITKTALSAPNTFTFATVPYSFSPAAVTQINTVHQIVDNPPMYWAPNHFDSNSFVASIKELAVRRGELNVLLSNTSSFPNAYAQNLSQLQTKAWNLLGFMLHAVEDFYAHSSWVDEGNTSNIVGFGALTENTAAPEEIQWGEFSANLLISRSHPSRARATMLKHVEE